MIVCVGMRRIGSFLLRRIRVGYGMVAAPLRTFGGNRCFSRRPRCRCRGTVVRLRVRGWRSTARARSRGCLASKNVASFEQTTTSTTTM